MDKKKLVLNIVKEYLYRGLTEEELKQAGLDGLEIAERKYDKRADFSFESYAVWWMDTPQYPPSYRREVKITSHLHIIREGGM